MSELLSMQVPTTLVAMIRQRLPSGMLPSAGIAGRPG